jgi:MFS family permease
MKWNRIAVSVFFFVSGFNFAAWAARIPALQKQLGLNDAQLGSLLAVLPTGLMLAMPLASVVLTKYGSKQVMLISSLCYTCLLCVLGTATHVAEAAVVLFLFGASRNFFNISVNTQSIGVQALYQKSIVTTFHGIWSLSALLGAALSFWFTRMQVSVLHHFIIVAIISIVLIALVYKYTLKEDKKSPTPTKGFAWPDKPLVKLGMIGFASMVCEGTMSDWCGI